MNPVDYAWLNFTTALHDLPQAEQEVWFCRMMREINTFSKELRASVRKPLPKIDEEWLGKPTEANHIHIKRVNELLKRGEK